jgi:CRISPR-associated protein Cmr1
VRQLVVGFQLVTPAFCGGADNVNGPAEIRLPSILGQIRWWWRALAWSRASGTEQDRLAKVHGWESALFGSDDTGSGEFVARLSHSKIAVDYGYGTLVGDQKLGIGYCAGQGLGKRYAVRRDTCFSIAFLQPRKSKLGLFTISDASKTEPPSLLEAVWALGLLGGIGSRSRRGFGSLSLVSWNVDPTELKIPTNIDEYKTCLCQLRKSFSKSGDGQPPFSAFAPCTKLAVSSGTHQSAIDIHSELGQEFSDFRNYRRRTADYLFVGDHDWFYKITGDGKAAAPATGSLFFGDSKAVAAAMSSPPTMKVYPERGVYGLPHNYSRTKSAGGPNGTKEVHRYEAKVGPAGSDIERRASPLQLHVHRLNDTSFVGVWTLFESLFLPNPPLSVDVTRNYYSHKEDKDKKVLSGSKTQPLKSGPALELPFNPDYVAIQEFLTRPASKCKVLSP